MGRYFDWNAEREDLFNTEDLINRQPPNDGINIKAMRAYRLSRLRTLMKENDMDAMILCDSVNIRYATGTRNMQIWGGRNAPARYLLLTSGRCILYEFKGCAHLANGFEDTVDEVRIAKAAQFNLATDIDSRESSWAKGMTQEISDLVGKKPEDLLVGLERFNAGAGIAMKELGVSVTDAQKAVEMAKAIKSADEVQCIIESLRATERGVHKLREAIQPGMTECELWSILHQSVIAQNGDYCETRLLNSGQRSNPWFQETSNAVIEPNTLICLDTDGKS